MLDTGILNAALVTSGTPPDTIYRAWRKNRFDLITFEWQLAELSRVSRCPKLRSYLRSAGAGTLVKGLRRQATVLPQLPTVDLSPDPDDNPVFAKALTSRADILVAGDRCHLLALDRIGSMRIVSARQFVDELRIPADS